jgi:hypothetical protein
MPDPYSQPQGPARYGDSRYCVKTPLSKDGEVYVMADSVAVDPSGALVFTGRFRDGDPDSPGRPAEATLILAPGRWTACYAASCLDGSAVAVERWEGEVVR